MSLAKARCRRNVCVLAVPEETHIEAVQVASRLSAHPGGLRGEFHAGTRGRIPEDAAVEVLSSNQQQPLDMTALSWLKRLTADLVLERQTVGEVLD
jgi:hypothetical protein